MSVSLTYTENDLPLRRSKLPSPTRRTVLVRKHTPRYTKDDMSSAEMREYEAERATEARANKIHVDLPYELTQVAFNPFWRGEELDGDYLVWLEDVYWDGNLPPDIRRINKFRGMAQLDDPAFGGDWRAWAEYYESDEGKAEIAPFERYIEQYAKNERGASLRSSPSTPGPLDEDSSSREASSTPALVPSGSSPAGNSDAQDQVSSQVPEVQQAPKTIDKELIDPRRVKQMGVEKSLAADLPASSLFAPEVLPKALRRGGRAPRVSYKGLDITLPAPKAGKLKKRKRDAGDAEYKPQDEEDYADGEILVEAPKRRKCEKSSTRKQRPPPLILKLNKPLPSVEELSASDQTIGSSATLSAEPQLLSASTAVEAVDENSHIQDEGLPEMSSAPFPDRAPLPKESSSLHEPHQEQLGPESHHPQEDPDPDHDYQPGDFQTLGDQQVFSLPDSQLDFDDELQHDDINTFYGDASFYDNLP